MESPTWPESLPINRKKAIQELTQGQEWTDRLREILQRSENIEADPTSLDGIVEQILGMFDNTLSIIGSWSSNERFQLPASYLQKSRKPDEPFLLQTSYLQSFCSSDEQISRKPIADDPLRLQSSYLESLHKSRKPGESTKMIIPMKIKRGCYSRKNSWTSTQVTSVLTDDGHAWRKYGQKKILECTYKLDQGCLATKQVQKIDNEPPLYKITYMRSHTCKNLQRASQIILDSRDPTDTSILLNFEAKGITGKKQVSPHFQTMKHDPEDGSLSLGHWRDNGSIPSNNYLSWNLNTQVSQIPLESISMSIRLDHEDMVSSCVYLGSEHGDMTSSEAYSSMASPQRHPYASSEAYSSMASTQRNEMDHMLGRNDFNGFSF
ncbi:DNA-binding WRKY [Cynara cardunculus var. scolymus]|uniref:DNA-binding WRKY n=1 Tax=Cynara cardunculus var. scolymus TaxID=59895 RepID=A0A124SCW0_CYNCS|nr:DNA-binding WRKY [Cynara cardunculus var. scolymus]